MLFVPTIAAAATVSWCAKDPTTPVGQIGTPERVFKVLTDAEAYPRWVVGAKQIRAVDAGWPAPGTAFHHSVGAGPASLDDATTVVELDSPRRMVLKGRARPLGTMAIVLDVRRAGDDTEITITENGEVYNPIFKFVSRFIIGHYGSIDDYLEGLKKVVR